MAYFRDTIWFQEIFHVFFCAKLFHWRLSSAWELAVYLVFLENVIQGVSFFICYEKILNDSVNLLLLVIYKKKIVIIIKDYDWNIIQNISVSKLSKKDVNGSVNEMN